MKMTGSRVFLLQETFASCAGIRFKAMVCMTAPVALAFGLHGVHLNQRKISTAADKKSKISASWEARRHVEQASQLAFSPVRLLVEHAARITLRHAR
jgi:thiamine monophosphate synthase